MIVAGEGYAVVRAARWLVSRVDQASIETQLQGDGTRRPIRTVLVGVVLFLVLSLLAWRLVPHPVGPARTYDKYRGKAVTTADAAQSDVATTLLALDAVLSGNSFGPYTSLVVSDAEDALAGVQGTFGSIQPPDAHADALRTELNALLSTAGDDVSTARIAARRGNLDGLRASVRPLAADSRHLQSFSERNS